MPSIVDLLNSETTERRKVNDLYIVFPATLSEAEKEMIGNDYLGKISAETLAAGFNRLKERKVVDGLIAPSEIKKILYTGPDPAGWIVLIENNRKLQMTGLGTCLSPPRKKTGY